jgi:hypothetical protein
MKQQQYLFHKILRNDKLDLFRYRRKQSRNQVIIELRKIITFFSLHEQFISAAGEFCSH